MARSTGFDPVTLIFGGQYPIQLNDAAHLNYRTSTRRTYHGLPIRTGALRQALDAREAAYLDHLKPMVLPTLNTGLRQGELFSLHWSDIDLEHRNLTVEGPYANSGTTCQISLNEEAVDVLEQWQSQTGDDSGFVLTGKFHGRMSNVRKAWNKLLQDADIEHFRWHDLRQLGQGDLLWLRVTSRSEHEVSASAASQQVIP